MIEELLQFLVGKVDAELLKAVELFKIGKAKEKKQRKGRLEKSFIFWEYVCCADG